MAKVKLTSALTLIMIFIFQSLAAQGTLSFEDVMKFEDIGSIEVSKNGNWLAYEVWPDRGDGRLLVRSVNDDNSYELALGKNPELSGDERWLVAQRAVRLEVQLEKKKDAPPAGMYILSLQNGEIQEFDSVRTWTLSESGSWIAIQNTHPKEIKDRKDKNDKIGYPVTLLNLDSGTSFNLPFVSSMAFDSLETRLVYSRSDTLLSENGLFAFDLQSQSTSEIHKAEGSWYENLTWDHGTQKLAFTQGVLDTTFTPGSASLHVWESDSGNLMTLITEEDSPDGYIFTTDNNLVFTNDSERLFFGFKNSEYQDSKEGENAEEVSVYDVEEIVEDRDLDIWHGDDPRIKTHEKHTWNSRKNHLYRAVYHLADNKWTMLADKSVPDIQISHNKNVVLGSSDEPWLKEITWEGFFRDWYWIDLEDGSKSKIAEKLSEGVHLSPRGTFAAYYTDKNWHLLDIRSGEKVNLTSGMDVPFYNEDHDYPSDVPDYGLAGWVGEDEAVMIYDKYDIWAFDTENHNALNMTEGKGREENRIFRIERMNKDRWESYEKGEELLLEMYHDLNKNFGFYTAKAAEAGLRRQIEEDKKFTFVGKAEKSDHIFYKREAYDEFPNIWKAEGLKFRKKSKLTHLHEDLKEKYNWGSAELIDWLSLDGTYIQGVVIKPDNYDPNKKYPVLTYYYRFFTNRLHDFNEPKTNHRPVFAQYVSDGYVVFLPDIRFEIGRPGFAATKSLVPGIHKLIELGIADEDKLGLHGHSWSGYQTAFIITQTDIFDAAVAGAPVSNMTSAYSGIRWGSGLARQFQYEKTQSRIGGSLVEYPERYIENSPVFFADKINTPLLIQHGDADGAVPWYQSIELYLAMRRFNKDVVFLQYHDEPHHLQKFSNQLDYAIRMKEYFDFYLKGEGEPKWIIEGEAFTGKK